MTMSDFILTNLEAILLEWERFAQTILPVTQDMDREALRDEAKGILSTIAQDMRTSQSSEQQRAKSPGRQVAKDAYRLDTSAKSHAGHRLSQGFDLNQVVSEYRALRASVVRLWTQHMREVNRESLAELRDDARTISHAPSPDWGLWRDGVVPVRESAMGTDFKQVHLLVGHMLSGVVGFLV